MENDYQQHEHQHLPSYRRSYKACLACRQRKSRCELGDNWIPGAPCKRCHRQMKNCIFPTERLTAKSGTQLPSQEAQLPEPQLVSQGSLLTSIAGQGSQEEDQSPLTAANARTPSTSSARHDGNVSDSIIRTMISSGNDALEVLFDPVRHEAPRRYPGEWQGVIAGDAMAMQTHMPPQLPSSHSRLRGPTNASPAQTVWHACRFVKQGWFSADEAIYLVDM